MKIKFGRLVIESYLSFFWVRLRRYFFSFLDFFEVILVSGSNKLLGLREGRKEEEDRVVLVFLFFGLVWDKYREVCFL